MSDNERVRGRLKKLSITEEEAKTLAFELGFNEEYFDESWKQTLVNETSDYAILNGEFYEIVDFSTTKNIYGCQLTNLDDDSILFDATYYNGGAHWTEVIEGALRKSKNVVV